MKVDCWGNIIEQKGLNQHVDGMGNPREGVTFDQMNAARTKMDRGDNPLTSNGNVVGKNDINVAFGYGNRLERERLDKLKEGLIKSTASQTKFDLLGLAYDLFSLLDKEEPAQTPIKKEPVPEKPRLQVDIICPGRPGMGTRSWYDYEGKRAARGARH